MSDTSKLFAAQQANFGHWEIIKDVIDQQIDLMLNNRQSGHPGGSRSKVHFLVSLLLGGGMRWDIRNPEKRFGDRFILVAGHTAPLAYAVLATFNEALRFMHKQTGDDKYLVTGGAERMRTWEDLVNLRYMGGLPGHVEMAGKNLIFAGGGIGLAPLRSLLWNCIDRRDEFGDITLIYGARSVAGAPVPAASESRRRRFIGSDSDVRLRR